MGRGAGDGGMGRGIQVWKVIGNEGVVGEFGGVFNRAGYGCGMGEIDGVRVNGSWRLSCTFAGLD